MACMRTVNDYAHIQLRVLIFSLSRSIYGAEAGSLHIGSAQKKNA